LINLTNNSCKCKGGYRPCESQIV